LIFKFLIATWKIKDSAPKKVKQSHYRPEKAQRVPGI